MRPSPFWTSWRFAATHSRTTETFRPDQFREVHFELQIAERSSQLVPRTAGIAVVMDRKIHLVSKVSFGRLPDFKMCDQASSSWVSILCWENHYSTMDQQLVPRGENRLSVVER